MTFEYDIEVRPKFEIPQWRGLRLEKWIVEVTPGEIEKELHRRLAERGSLEPVEEPAQPGDYIVVDLQFFKDGQIIAQSKEEVIRVKPVLSFYDARIEEFDKLMAGVRAGDQRQCVVQVLPSSPDITLRGTQVLAVFKVHEVKRLRLPEFDQQLLEELGVASEEELRAEIKYTLSNRKQYHSNRHFRDQITQLVTAGATWELPPRVLAAQAHREMQRLTFELRGRGFDDQTILMFQNRMRSNIWESVATALREHFILEAIAEAEGIQVSEDDILEEIRLMSAYSGESPRRLRARLEKTGGMDILANLALERKVLDRIIAEAEIVAVPMPALEPEEVAIDRAVGGAERPEEALQRLEEDQTAKAAEHEPAHQGDERRFPRARRAVEDEDAARLRGGGHSAAMRIERLSSEEMMCSASASASAELSCGLRARPMRQ